MRFIDYIKERGTVLVINYIILFILVVFLIAGKTTSILILYVVVFWSLSIASILINDFFCKKRYYKELIQQFEKIDKKYLINEMIDKPEFLEGKIYYNIISECNKCMHEEINEYKRKQKEYKEYIESWIHEIKTPIASSKLIVENNKNDITLSILEEIEKVEFFSEQVLYYARSNDVAKDYIIKKINLGKLINSVIKKNSKYFIQNKIKLKLGNVDESIYSDSKWIEFILNQVINNSIKYRNEESSNISVFTSKNENSVELHIKDNGIGIADKDLGRVFNKGFTGENGRVFSRSTGMGLYLVKKLCLKLSLEVFINSKVNEGTEVIIIFPIDEDFNFLRNKLT